MHSLRSRSPCCLGRSVGPEGGRPRGPHRAVIKVHGWTRRISLTGWRLPLPEFLGGSAVIPEVKHRGVGHFELEVSKGRCLYGADEIELPDAGCHVRTVLRAELLGVERADIVARRRIDFGLPGRGDECGRSAVGHRIRLDGKRARPDYSATTSRSRWA